MIPLQVSWGVSLPQDSTEDRIMTRYRVAQGVLLLCVVAAPFLKAFLVRRGMSSRLAYASGFTLLAFAAIVVRLSRG
jgi:hypothetical protein